MYQRSVSWWNRRGLKFGCCSSISPLISILSQAAADPVLPGHKLREREMVSRDSSTKVLPLLWPTILTPSLTRIYHQSSYTKNCCTNTSYWIIQHEYVQNYDKLQATSWTNHSQFTICSMLAHWPTRPTTITINYTTNYHIKCSSPLLQFICIDLGLKYSTPLPNFWWWT